MREGEARFSKHRVPFRIAFAALALFVVFASATALAEEIVTTSGRVLKEAGIVSIEGNFASVKHTGGTERLALSEIPQEMQENFRQREMRRKADEVETLKQELARREKELKQLQQDNEKLRRESAAKAAQEGDDALRREAEIKKLKEENERLGREQKQAVAAAVVAAAPSKPLDEVPPVNPTEVIEAKDLALYYKADPSAADQRFRKKIFRIRGVVDRFWPWPFVRRYDVGLESLEREIGLVCKFHYRDEWKAVYASDRGRVLMARLPGAERPLMKAGETVTIQGRCEGRDGRDVIFSGCALIQ
jgi:hypothetical protein